jgi:hypothetical protein
MTFPSEPISLEAAEGPKATTPTRGRPTVNPATSNPARWAVAPIVVGLLIPLAFGRWGSYLHLPGTSSIYLSDALILLPLAYLALTRFPPYRPPGTYAVVVIGLSTALIGILRGWGNPATLIIRDATPVAYLTLTPFIMTVLRGVKSERLFRWIGLAACAHSLWFVPAMAGSLTPIDFHIIAGTAIFTVRGDLDILICGVAIGYCIVGSDRLALLRTVWALLSAYGCLTQGSRGGLIGASLIIATVVMASKSWRNPRNGYLYVIAGFILAALATLWVWLSHDVPTWASTLRKLIPQPGSVEAQRASNTTNARLDAWQDIADFTTSDRARALFGSGFGSSVNLDSGAVRYLSGDPNVRAAHNFVVTWFGELGFIGTALAMTLVFCLLYLSRRPPGRSASWTVGRGLQLGLLAASLVGVILESPFGYMLFILGTVQCVLSHPSRKAPASA